MLEHLNQGGLANGELVVTHTNLTTYGLSNDGVRPAIDEAVAFGSLRVIRPPVFDGRRISNQFRLTWIGGWDAEGGLVDPTNEWKGVTEDFVEAYKKDRQQRRVARRRRKR